MLIAVILGCLGSTALAQVPSDWKREWPDTDFTRSSVKFSEVISGGPPKDGIPAIDNPEFIRAADASELAAKEPIIYLNYGDEIRAYPFRILIWHEIVNDEINGLPITVTYCPLCNAAVVFDRRINGEVLDFGVSGKLRFSDMIMYDRQTETWWQQFNGMGIIGEMTGVELKRLPARVIPFSQFKQRYPDAKILVSPNPGNRPYGQNPYVGYDSSSRPFLYNGRYDGPGSPMSYVVSVEEDAWMLTELRAKGQIIHQDLVISWREGMSSALDKSRIGNGRDIGYVEVQKRMRDGALLDISYDMTFAFVFKAFHPEGVIHTR
jgi:hypothetical protein